MFPSHVSLQLCVRGGCVVWLGSGLARGLVDLNACVASSTPNRHTRSEATANRPAAHPHATAPPHHQRHAAGGAPTLRLTGRWRYARAQALFAAQAPPSGRATEPALPGRRRGPPQGEAAKRRRGRFECLGRRTRMSPMTWREVSARNGFKPKQQAAARQCTARHPSPAPPVVPRETPTRPPGAPPAHPKGACPSSPSTPPPASAPHATRW